MNELSFREAAIVRYALRMLHDKVARPDQVHHLTGSKFATPEECVIHAQEVRLLVGRII